MCDDSEDIAIDGIIFRHFYTVVCVIKRKLHGGLKISILFSSGKSNILSTRWALS